MNAYKAYRHIKIQIMNCSKNSQNLKSKGTKGSYKNEHKQRPYFKKCGRNATSIGDIAVSSERKTIISRLNLGYTNLELI